MKPNFKDFKEKVREQSKLNTAHQLYLTAKTFPFRRDEDFNEIIEIYEEKLKHYRELERLYQSYFFTDKEFFSHQKSNSQAI